ncbi:hypothetical protein CSOJ01_01595 [Colletotrichum sojae]|uniref:Uncharacterized protein n=1 Tax=Colletotrichum sojae TaxID=2175907 RepID=A0A8H6JTX8_9PEZI|nr:hypothetical protein CSOJ01_01595 [Colletotrichum sojae]
MCETVSRPTAPGLFLELEIARNGVFLENTTYGQRKMKRSRDEESVYLVDEPPFPDVPAYVRSELPTRCGIPRTTGPVDKLNSPPPGRPIPSHPSSKLHISPGALTSSRALTLQPLVIGSFLSSASLPQEDRIRFLCLALRDDANARYATLLCSALLAHYRPLWRGPPPDVSSRLGNKEDFEVLPGVQFRELIDLFEPSERAQLPPTSSPNTSTVLDKSQRVSFVRSVSRLVRQFRLVSHGTVTGIAPVFGCAFGTYPPAHPDDLKQDPVASPDTRITSTHKPLACPARNQPIILRLDSAISIQRPARHTNIGTSRVSLLHLPSRTRSDTPLSRHNELATLCIRLDLLRATSLLVYRARALLNRIDI